MDLATLKATLAAAKNAAIVAKTTYQTELAALDARRAEIVSAIAEIDSELGIPAAPTVAPKTRKLGDLASRILEKMETGKIYTPSELATALNEDSVYLGVPLRQLQDRGFIRKIDRGQYERLASALTDATEAPEAPHVDAPDATEVIEEQTV